MAGDHSSEHIEALMRAVGWLCRPLVRLLIRKGVSYPQMREHLKRIYVTVAEEEFAVDGRPPSDSRIHVLTGVHRKDVRRLRGGGAEPSPDTGAGIGGAVVSRWLGLPEYRGPFGEPRCLPRRADEEGPGFDELVAEVSRDVRPRAVLDELERLGIVRRDGNGRICLERRAFVPDRDFVRQTFYLGRNVHDHLAACVHNMEGGDRPMLERAVYYAGLRPESVAELRAMAEDAGARLLEDLNRRALELQRADAGHSGADRRMRFGCYWYDGPRRGVADEENE